MERKGCEIWANPRQMALAQEDNFIWKHVYVQCSYNYLVGI